MGSFTNLLLAAACAALLLDCEARQVRNHRPSRGHRRNSNDASVALGQISGSKIINLPEIQLSGPDVIVGFPDNCKGDEGLELLGTVVLVTTIDAGLSVDLVPDDANDPQSNVAIHCNWEYSLRCPNGVNVASFQYCGNPLPPPPPPPPPSSSSSSEGF